MEGDEVQLGERMPKAVSEAVCTALRRKFGICGAGRNRPPRYSATVPLCCGRVHGRVVGTAGEDGVVAHAGVVGLMAVILWSWSIKKGRHGRTALSVGYSFLLWGYHVDG